MDTQNKTESQGKVLIVDDKKDNLLILSVILRNKGYEVKELQSGHLVFDYVKKTTPDLILLDIMMPDISGFDICKQLKNEESTRDIPVIFISALSSNNYIVKAFSAGGIDYVTRPFQKNELLARVGTHIALRKSQQRIEAQNLKFIQDDKALLESKKNFEGIFNAVSDMLIIADMDGKIVNANPKAIESYGYSKEEFLKLEVSQLIHEDNRHLFKKYISDILTNGVSHIESKEIRKDGSFFIAEVKGSFVEYNGKPHLLGVLRDITKQKQEERDLIEAKKASDSANKAKSNFLAVMSHEIRTPMNAIIGMTDLTLQTNPTPEQESNLNIIKESTSLLLDIINDVLDFSKIEAGKLTLEKIDFDLHTFLDNLISIFIVQVENKGLSITLQKSDQLPRYIKVDQTRLKQILVNLINNAIKFTETGAITINASQDNNSLLKFSVKDTGIGISEENQNIIFNSFSQAELSTTRKHGGTGLGLAICKKLVEMMGGKIYLESKPDFGSTFSFQIKFEHGDKNKVKTEAQTENWEQLKTDCKKLNILIVEDNLMNIKIAEQFLIKLGHSFSTVRNGKEALEILSQVRFNIILMDVEMPEMNGLEATRRIRNGEAGSVNSGTPIIAMTAHALDNFRIECESAGMNDFVSKPVNFYELGMILKKYSSSHNYCTDKNVNISNDKNNLVVDKKEAIIRLGGCEEIFDMVCQSFLNDIAGLLENIKQGVNKKDYEAIRFNAHTIKGLCGNINANSSINLAKKLEHLASEGEKKFDQINPVLEKLLKELDKVKEIIA